MNPIKELENLGQSVWLDFIDRDLIKQGGLDRYISEAGITGVTSNPSIFEKAIGQTGEYDTAIDKILESGDRDVISIYEELAIQDIRDAADILHPTFERMDGRDGFISLEVSPYLAHDTIGTIREARRLWKAVNRPNVMIKVPATQEGIPAIEQLIQEGINVNITLLFSVSVYEQVAEAFLKGLETRQARGESLDSIGSVASFFVSRIDTAVDKLIEQKSSDLSDETERARLLGLRGKVAIASAKCAYEVFQKICSSPRWEKLAAAGAKPQRLLWASTSTKNPSYSDVMYIEGLVGRDTVNTVPTQTLTAFKDHGQATEALTVGLKESKEVLSNLKEATVDLDQVTRGLTVDGVGKFSATFDQLLGSLQKKRETQLGSRLNGFSYHMPQELDGLINRTINEWQEQGRIRAEWKHDSSLWTRSGEEKWLGWLDVPVQELEAIDEIQEFANGIKKEGYRHVVLLGMGGSSLGAEVFSKTLGALGIQAGYPEFHVLDSTDPNQIKTLEQKLAIERTLFVVSSKSGSTLEPNIFYDYFADLVKQRLGEASAGMSFVAITDPGSPLEARAHEAKFRKVFSGVPSIGGRYSVLSNFGIVPAALMGIDVKRLLTNTLHMVRSCRSDVPASANPGVILGILLGISGKHGRDKVTLVCSEEIYDLGAWLEQLLAESTGKEGKGLIPIDREPVGEPGVYGSDRLFVYLRSQSSADPSIDLKMTHLQTAGHPVIKIEVSDLYNIGQEFFRWEMATSVAGAVLEINPFDQPDVEESKEATRRLTTAFEKKGELPSETPIFESEDLQIFDESESAVQLKNRLGESPEVSDYLRAHMNRIGVGDYFAILAYLPMNKDGDEILQAMRSKVMNEKNVATTVEFGPRFLHSTGQAYKGGTNSGVFLQITTEDPVDLPVPGHKYSFGVVKAAEARGDLEVLTHRNRRAMRIHLRKGPKAGLQSLQQEFEKAGA